MARVTRDFDILLIGAGFSGIYLLLRLRELGFNVHLVDAAAGVGGVWHWNCYPGARVDTHADIYQFSDPELWKDWEWTERFPGWQEMRSYFEFVDKKRSVSKDVSYGTRVTAASFDENRRRWLINTDVDVDFTAQFMLPCTGFASKPYVPKIQGLDSFSGEAYHTAQWPQEGMEFKGKKIGVVGTGASGIQVAQEAFKEAERTVVFQRTPNMYLPMGQRPFSSEDNAVRKLQWPARFQRRGETFGGFDFDFIKESALGVSPSERELTYESLWEAGGFNFWLGTFSDVITDQRANDTAYDFWRRKVRARIKDPATADILAPAVAPHPYGVKRPSLEQGFFDIFNHDNADLVCLKRTPITEIVPGGIKTTEDFFELDVIAYATGFDAVTGGIMNINITGTAESTISQKWGEGVRTHLGVATSEFPNLLMSYGPQAPTGFCNGPSSAEFQGECIVELLVYLRDKGISRIEAEPAAEEAWRRSVIELADATLFPKANSWYMGANIPGKPKEMLMYPGGLPRYLESFRQSRDDGYAGFALR